METAIRSIGIQVRDVTVLGGHLVGFLADEAIPPSPRAKYVPPLGAFRQQIENHTLATAVPPFFLPLASVSGFFRTIETDVLTVFLGLRRDDSDIAKRFLRDYGLWSESDLYKDRAEHLDRLSKPVRAWWKDAERRKETPFATSLSDFWLARWVAESLNDLTDAVLRSDMARSETLCAEIGDYFIKGYKKAPDVEKEAHFLLAGVTGRMLESARIAPVEENGQVFPVISTAFSRDAVFAQLMLQLVEDNPLRRCRRLDCNNIFVPGRSDQWYCCGDCQELNKRRRQLGKPTEDIERANTSLRERTSHAKRSDRKN